MSKVKSTAAPSCTQTQHICSACVGLLLRIAQVTHARLLLAKVLLCVLLCKDLPVPIQSHPTKKDPVLLPALLCATHALVCMVCTSLALPLCASNAAHATLFTRPHLCT